MLEPLSTPFPQFSASLRLSSLGVEPPGAGRLAEAALEATLWPHSSIRPKDVVWTLTR